MEAWIRADVASIHAASRASGISEAKDDIRAQLAGHPGVVSLVDGRDKTVKLRISGPAPGIPVGRAAEVWFPADALWDARLMKAGCKVRICKDEDAILKASRQAGEFASELRPSKPQRARPSHSSPFAVASPLTASTLACCRHRH